MTMKLVLNLKKPAGEKPANAETQTTTEAAAPAEQATPAKATVDTTSKEGSPAIKIQASPAEGSSERADASPEMNAFLTQLANMEAIISEEISPEVSLQQLKEASVSLKDMLNATPELALQLSSDDIGLLANQLRRVADDALMVKAESKAAPKKRKAKKLEATGAKVNLNHSLEDIMF